MNSSITFENRHFSQNRPNQNFENNRRSKFNVLRRRTTNFLKQLTSSLNISCVFPLKQSFRTINYTPWKSPSFSRSSPRATTLQTHCLSFKIGISTQIFPLRSLNVLELCIPIVFLSNLTFRRRSSRDDLQKNIDPANPVSVKIDIFTQIVHLQNYRSRFPNAKCVSRKENRHFHEREAKSRAVEKKPP